MRVAEDRRVRVIALGSPHGGDDELALELGRALAQLYGAGIELRLAGRPGPGLVELLATEQPVVLLDVVRSAAAAGTVHRIALAELRRSSLARDQVSSHGFGPGEALALAEALGRPLPRGVFVGVEGEQFELGVAPSAAMRRASEAFMVVARAAIDALANPEPPSSAAQDAAQPPEDEACTSPV